MNDSESRDVLFLDQFGLNHITYEKYSGHLIINYAEVSLKLTAGRAERLRAALEVVQRECAEYRNEDS